MENLSQLYESTPAFLDYKIKSPRLLGARKQDLEVGDLVTDEYGIIGIVKFHSEKYGNLIEFVDGLEVYESIVKNIRKLSTTNPALFDYNQRYFGFITRLGRVMLSSISDDFPHSNMFNNGRVLFVRGSTVKGSTIRFVAQKIGDSHNYFSAILTPFWSCHIEALHLKTSLRKSKFTYNLLKKLFIDIDLQVPSANRINFKISSHNEYNDKWWALIQRQFAKFKLKRARGD